MECSQVLILTNANFQWIKYSLKTYFQTLFHFILHNKIPIISSYDLFSSQYPSNPLSWKYHSLHLLVELLISSGYLIHHITSIGDSIYEKIASNYISLRYDIPCHLIQFLSHPTITQLTQQLIILQKYFYFLNLSNNNNLYQSYLPSISLYLSQELSHPNPRDHLPSPTPSSILPPPSTASIRSEYHMILLEGNDINIEEEEIVMILQEN